jgi:DNA repair ATPase RecN
VAGDRRAYDTGASGQVQEKIKALVNRLDGLLEQRDSQVKQAMADFTADGIDEQYRDVEKRWSTAAAQVNTIIDLLRQTMADNDAVAQRTKAKASRAVTGI